MTKIPIIGAQINHSRASNFYLKKSHGDLQSPQTNFLGQRMPKL